MKNYRIRKLIDGRYVAEVKTGWWIFGEWKPLAPNGATYYAPYNIAKCCIFNTEDEAKSVAASHLISE